jgi:hypothetical protein
MLGPVLGDVQAATVWTRTVLVPIAVNLHVQSVVAMADEEADPSDV